MSHPETEADIRWTVGNAKRLERENIALRAVVQQALDAFDKGALALSSVEVGDEDSGVPMHPWHEEWLHHARAAIVPQQETIGTKP